MQAQATAPPSFYSSAPLSTQAAISPSTRLTTSTGHRVLLQAAVQANTLRALLAGKDTGAALRRALAARRAFEPSERPLGSAGHRGVCNYS
jgi:hypothetical protein